MSDFSKKLIEVALPLDAQRLGLDKLCQRSKPGGCADQQGHNRDPAQVRRQATGKPGSAGFQPASNAARMAALPGVNRVVLVGSRLSPGNPVTKPDDTVVRALWQGAGLAARHQEGVCPHPGRR